MLWGILAHPCGLWRARAHVSLATNATSVPVRYTCGSCVQGPGCTWFGAAVPCSLYTRLAVAIGCIAAFNVALLVSVTLAVGQATLISSAGSLCAPSLPSIAALLCRGCHARARVTCKARAWQCHINVQHLGPVYGRATTQINQHTAATGIHARSNCHLSLQPMSRTTNVTYL